MPTTQVQECKNTPSTKGKSQSHTWGRGPALRSSTEGSSGGGSPALRNVFADWLPSAWCLGQGWFGSATTR